MISEKESQTPSIKEAVPEAAAKPKEVLTVLWDEIEEWQRDNKYITTGYRPTSNSYRKSAASLGYLHNETVNIWTHLLGAVAAMVIGGLMYRSVKPRYHMASDEDVLVFFCFFLGAAACLGMSATFHAISNHSEAVAKFGNRLDHMGIVCLIWGSFIPSIYYGFAAEPQLIRLYWTMITTIAVATLALVCLPKFRTPDWRPVRALAFVLMGLSAVVPVLHGVQMYGVAQLQRQIGLSWLVTQGVLYIVGAAIYAARIPEKWSPVTFDIVGSSHQIFHVLVLLAAGVHLVGLLKAFDYEHGNRSSMMDAYAKARTFGQNN